MKEVSVTQTGPLLELYLSADNGVVSAELMTRLVEERIDPIIKASIRRKLSVSLGTSDERRENEDARDLFSEARTLVIDKLQKLRSGNGNAIEDLDAYVRQVAVNVCNKYLREKYPNRLRLKNQLRYLFSHDQRFSLWQSNAGEWLCGSSSRSLQHNSNGNPTRMAEINEEVVRSFEREGPTPESMPLADLAAAILEPCTDPVLFAEVVNCIYTLRRISEPSDITHEAAAARNLSSHERSATARLENTELLGTIWGEIKQLPFKHRSTLILSLRDSSGEGVVAMLPIARVATMRQIADVLQMDPVEFARIWNDLPWDDRKIGDHLGLTRQQVINLRHWARVALKKRILSKR